MTSKVSRLASTILWSGIQTFPVYFCHLGSLWYLRLLCYVSLTVMLLVPLVLTIVSPVRCLTMLWPSSKGSQQSKCTEWNFMFILYRTWSVHLFMLGRPFGRLWWDEIVPTVVTRAEPHNQVKTIRIPFYIYSTKPVFFFLAIERGWSFADYFASQSSSSFDHPGKCKAARFSWLLQAVWPNKAEVTFSTMFTSVRLNILTCSLFMLWSWSYCVVRFGCRYMQVGNAVAVPVARALGCSLGMAYMGRLDGDGPLFKLPKSFTRTPVVFSGGEDADMEQVLDW